MTTIFFVNPNGVIYDNGKKRGVVRQPPPVKPTDGTLRFRETKGDGQHHSVDVYIKGKWVEDRWNSGISKTPTWRNADVGRQEAIACYKTSVMRQVDSQNRTLTAYRPDPEEATPAQKLILRTLNPDGVSYPAYLASIAKATGGEIALNGGAGDSKSYVVDIIKAAKAEGILDRVTGGDVHHLKLLQTQGPPWPKVTADEQALIQELIDVTVAAREAADRERNRTRRKDDDFAL
jgi:hypothetical protein